MRLVEFLNEAKFRKPVVMYHGTSNAHIRSILKRGIIPEPVEKVWATDPDLSPHSFSRASLRGSYWSANLGTASSSSTTATYQKHFGGSPLIVVAQISEGSAYADEDDLNFKINWAMGHMYHDLFGGNLIAEAVPKASALYYWGEGKQNEMVQSFGEALHESASIDPEKQPIDWSFMEELLKAIMLRQLAYEIFEQERSKSYYKDLYVREMQRLQGEGKAPPIPSIEEAENILLRLRETLTRMYRMTVYPEKSQSVLRNTLRTTQPVTYRGANRILAILGDPPRGKSDKGSEWWTKPKILYYGSPPEDYFKQYREFMGSFPGAVNTRGQMVIQPDEKKKVAASIGEAARHDVSVSRLGLYLHDLIARYMDKMGEQDEYGGYYGFEWKRIKGGDTQFRQSFDTILNRMGVSDDSNFSIMGPVWFSPYKLRKGLLALKPYASDSGFGFTPDGQPAILIAIRSEQNLPINFQNERTPFVHEFTHFLDHMRSTDKERAGVNPRKEGFTAYYSDPKEFNAYFQEVAGEFVERVKGVKTKEQAQRILGHNFPEFLEKIMDLFPEMYREIPKYDRKAKTRFYKFYAELLDRYF